MSFVPCIAAVIWGSLLRKGSPTTGRAPTRKGEARGPGASPEPERAQDDPTTSRARWKQPRNTRGTDLRKPEGERPYRSVRTRGHPRRRRAPHGLPLRPARGHRTAPGAATPGPALPHPDPGYSLTVTPAEHFINWQQDVFGNHPPGWSSRSRPASWRSPSTWSPTWPSINPFDFFVEDAAERVPVRLRRRAGADDLVPVPAPRRRARRPARVRRRAAARPGWTPSTPMPPRAPRSSTSSSTSTAGGRRRARTRCAWNRACRPPTRPWSAASGPAGTAPGCWWRSCASSVSRPGSCPVTWSSWST